MIEIFTCKDIVGIGLLFETRGVGGTWGTKKIGLKKNDSVKKRSLVGMFYEKIIFRF